MYGRRIERLAAGHGENMDDRTSELAKIASVKKSVFFNLTFF